MTAILAHLCARLGLAREEALGPLAAAAADLREEIARLEARIGALFDEAYAAAPVVRIHHGAPRVVH